MIDTQMFAWYNGGAGNKLKSKKGGRLRRSGFIRMIRKPNQEKIQSSPIVIIADSPFMQQMMLWLWKGRKISFTLIVGKNMQKNICLILYRRHLTASGLAASFRNGEGIWKKWDCTFCICKKSRKLFSVLRSWNGNSGMRYMRCEIRGCGVRSLP